MVKRSNPLQLAWDASIDLLSAAAAFGLAYFVRFHTPFVHLVAVSKGTPPFSDYLMVLPFLAALVPIAFYIQGVYRPRRTRRRLDDFFAVLAGSVLAVVLGIIGTLYTQAYYPSMDYAPISRAVWALFLTSNVLLAYASRELRWRWRATVRPKRALIVGDGDLARAVADRLLDRGEPEFQPVGFVDDRAPASGALEYRGLPLLGPLVDIPEVCRRNGVDEIYVALPIEEHFKTLDVLELASREWVDVHVVPDLLQFLALRARLDDLDGLPIISINDVPLRGIRSVVKRAIDIVLSCGALLIGAIPAVVVAGLVKRSSPGPVFYAQQRMGLDGRTFTAYKFRTMPVDAEDGSGPVWGREDDPRATAIGRRLRRSGIDELPQLWNVLKGEMSIVGPRPERPHFVEKFGRRIPRYMLRHKVRAGITGWAQVNGWRGDTSLEKRVEYDLYYIQNWSLALDFKIIWLTFVRAASRLAGRSL